MLWFQINRVIVREAEQLETFASVFLAGNIQQKKKESLLCTHSDVLWQTCFGSCVCPHSETAPPDMTFQFFKCVPVGIPRKRNI